MPLFLFPCGTSGRENIVSTGKVVGKLRVLKTKEQCSRPKSIWGKNKDADFHFWNRDQIYPPICSSQKIEISININIYTYIMAYKTLDIK